jgi:hypothetical protein
MKRLWIAVLLAACCPPGAHPAKVAAPVVVAPPPVVAPPAPVLAELASLTEGQTAHGFTARAVYLDGAERPIGARFVHVATGFTFDYLRIESAPQGFVWVTTFPTSDKGEPHTQEHLLLGKGDRGRRLGSEESMALASSSAFTAQWRTAYHFHTVAGPEVYWDVFAGQLDALLHPDYTDEEIRREVRNFGVDADAAGALHLEEKGTVYNEMVRMYESPDAVLWHAIGGLVYGPRHPLAFEAGGYPDAIRTMTPEDIRAFHERAYHLPNMGVIGAFPSAMPLDDVLARTAKILDAAGDRGGRAQTLAELPAAAPAAAGAVAVVDYPFGDATNPGPVALAWPPMKALDPTEHALLGLFLDALAGDAGTPLYQALIDGKTRALDLGASGVGGMVADDQGEVVSLTIGGVKADRLDEATLRKLRDVVGGELRKLADATDGDPALAAFDGRVRSRIAEARRRYARFLDSPPGFGIRGTGSQWMDHLERLARAPGFRKSLTLRATLDAVDAIVARGGNPWRTRLKEWGLLAPPFAIAARPSPARAAELAQGRAARIKAELDRLRQGQEPDGAALARYRASYDATTAALEQAAKGAALPALVATPPMTLDDGLATGGRAGTLGPIATYAATFDAMTSARVELSLPIGGQIAPADQVFLAALPSLLRGAGVIDGGKPIAAAELAERLRREILGLTVGYTANPRTHRLELVIAGAGQGAAETQAALGWMRKLLLAPDWRVENLPRLRDLIAQELTGLRQVMLGSEEGWVADPRDAWRHQRWSEYAHAASFLTRAHDLHRLRWMLEDPLDPAARAEAAAALTKLAEARALPRAELAALARWLAAPSGPAPAKAARFVVLPKAPKAAVIVVDAGKDLTVLLADLPDATLAADWAYLCREMAADLSVGAPAALARLAAVRAKVVDAAHARLVIVGGSATQQAIAGDLAALAAALPRTTAAAPRATEGEPVFAARLAQHAPGPATFVGLFAPGTSSGVFLNLAPLTGYADTSDDAVLDYLAANLYTGHGGHSMFMKTWAAGLAYSNGLHPHLGGAELEYYAERCPLLPQTIKFVIAQLQAAAAAPVDGNLGRYAVAGAFGSRSASGFEARASAMAADLVDGITPEVVRAFRAKVLAQAARPDLATALFARMKAVYAKVLPGLGAVDPAATYFVIGPEAQLAAYEAYLRGAVGKAAAVRRLYPRDFWIPAWR